MSSLPFATYHRASQLGEGAFGSVVTVYNDDGQEFALKLFLPDDDSDDEYSTDSDSDSSSSYYEQQPIELGALREISCLRLLRHVQHPNIVYLHDIQPFTQQGGAGTEGCLGMAIPLYRHGNLADAIERQLFRAYPRRVKVQLAHDLLSAVAFLHDNGILHRDIKSDNVLLHTNDDNEDDWRAVLIDFSHAKPVDDTIYRGQPPNHPESIMETTRHTGSVGTLIYTAPEVLARQPYSKPMDLWSIGVILLELLLNEPAETKAKQVENTIQTRLARLPAQQPFPDLVRGLLQTDPSQRLTARQALGHALFGKFGFPVPKLKYMCVATALPYDNDEGDSTENAPPNSLSNNRNANKLEKRLEKRLATIRRICTHLNSQNPITPAAALEYSVQFEQLETIHDSNATQQALLDCVVLAHRFFEYEGLDLGELDAAETGIFGKWTYDDHVDNEATLFMLLDFCLYPRKPRLDSL